MRDVIVRAADEVIQNGGSAVSGPEGTWVLEPVENEEGLLYAEIDPVQVRRARQTFDSSGHYGRPDILRLTVDRTRHSVLFKDPPPENGSIG